LTAYAVAVVAAAVSASIVRWYLTPALGGQNWFDDDVPLAVQRTEMLFNAILQMVQTGFGTAAWLHLREREATSRRLQASELRRAKAEQHMQETQLRALQARVDPELLFGALQRVGELAGANANERADRLLDEPIALLRLLVPSGSSAGNRTVATVEQELATAVAYLRVDDACAGASREVDVTIAADTAARLLPPMLVLPIARAIARREGAVRTPLRIRARCAAGRLSLDFRRDDAGAEPLVDGNDLAELRRRLDETFGSGAASAVATDSPATLAVELPLAHDPDPTDSTDR
jgi:LytS/YehU family sensor histidine kinase